MRLDGRLERAGFRGVTVQWWIPEHIWVCLRIWIWIWIMVTCVPLHVPLLLLSRETKSKT
jgi:hypothetical protein